MPDTMIRPRANLSQTEMIRALREPLPSHELPGGNFRKWAVAVCTAEVKHRERDYERVEALLGLNTDRWDFPGACERGQFLHEKRASEALNWLRHLQTHESEKRTPWSFIPWTDWKRERRAAWVARRRVLWAGFLRSVRKYQEARRIVK